MKVDESVFSGNEYFNLEEYNSYYLLFCDFYEEWMTVKSWWDDGVHEKADGFYFKPLLSQVEEFDRGVKALLKDTNILKKIESKLSGSNIVIHSKLDDIESFGNVLKSIESEVIVEGGNVSKLLSNSELIQRKIEKLIGEI